MKRARSLVLPLASVHLFPLCYLLQPLNSPPWSRSQQQQQRPRSPGRPSGPR